MKSYKANASLGDSRAFGFFLSSLMLWCFFNASLSVYLIPLAIKSQLIRVLAMDMWALVSFAGVLSFMPKQVSQYQVRIESGIFLILMVCFFSSLINGYFYQGYGESALREFRFLLYFMVVFLFFQIIYNRYSDRDRVNRILILVTFSMMAGNIFYFLLSKYLLQGVSLYYLSPRSYGDDFIGAFSMGASQKFKFAPPLVMFSQLILYILYVDKRIPGFVFLLMSILLIGVSLGSNMRSVLLAEAFAIVIVIGHTVFNSTNIKNMMASVILIAVASSVIIYLENAVSILGNERFSTQVADKGVTSAELSNRIEGLYIALGLKESIFQDFLGLGAGSAYDGSLWQYIMLNPADSGFFNLLLSGGYFSLVVFLLFSLVLMIKGILGVASIRKLMIIAICSSYLVAFFNMFNDSPFLSMSDTFIYAMLASAMSSSKYASYVNRQNC